VGTTFDIYVCTKCKRFFLLHSFMLTIRKQFLLHAIYFFLSVFFSFLYKNNFCLESIRAKINDIFLSKNDFLYLRNFLVRGVSGRKNWVPYFDIFCTEKNVVCIFLNVV